MERIPECRRFVGVICNTLGMASKNEDQKKPADEAGAAGASGSGGAAAEGAAPKSAEELLTQAAERIESLEAQVLELTQLRTKWEAELSEATRNLEEAVKTNGGLNARNATLVQESDELRKQLSTKTGGDSVQVLAGGLRDAAIPRDLERIEGTIFRDKLVSDGEAFAYYYESSLAHAGGISPDSVTDTPGNAAGVLRSRLGELEASGAPNPLPEWTPETRVTVAIVIHN